jgi:hypothetical protein
VNAAWDEEVYAIADGRDLDDVRRRAQQARDWAREAEARYPSLRGISKRSQAAVAAWAWAAVEAYMRDTGATVFDREAFRADTATGRLDGFLAWLDPWAWISVIRVLFGRGGGK